MDQPMSSGRRYTQGVGQRHLAPSATYPSLKLSGWRVSSADTQAKTGGGHGAPR